MIAAAADALKTPFERGADLRQLEADLDGLVAAHWADTADRLAVPAGEFDEDMRRLDQLAAGITRAARSLSALSANNIAANCPTLAQDDCADIFDDALDGLLHLSAARVLSAAIKVRLAGGG
jgi:hypothetical protein